MTFASTSLPIRASSDQDRQPAAFRRFAAMLAVAFAITAIGLLVAPSPAAAWSSGEFSSASEKQLVTLTNQSRAAAGLKALKVDSKLTAIARSRSKDMIVRNYFSHDIPPSGKQVFSILDDKGYCYKVAGENIGWNNYPDNVATKTIHQLFMSSSGHRANILGKRWDVIGIGAYEGPNDKKMWTVLFADKCGSVATAPKPKPAATPKPVARAQATPRPTPRPTPKPTPVPTPVKTMPPEPTDPIGLGMPGDRTQEPEASPPPGAATLAADAGSLRVVDPASPPGLVESIVGNVTGLLFGG
jgi:uncharacterized protein YkwD